MGGWERVQKAVTRVAQWPSVKSTKKCQSPEPKPRKHCMFASYEVATSFPSLTAIKGYDLDKSTYVPLMGHNNRTREKSYHTDVYKRFISV